MNERLCGPDCMYPDMPHREPEPDWIGDVPVMHGGSDYPVPGTGGWNGLYNAIADDYRLCGHPNHLTCPHFIDGGIGGWTFERKDSAA